MGQRDYYEVLDVPRDADLPTIKRAFRKAAMQFHPDRNPGDPEAEERFKEAGEAFAVLGDTEKRQRYDRFGREAVREHAAGFDRPELVLDLLERLGDFVDLAISSAKAKEDDITVEIPLNAAKRLYNAAFRTLSISYERRIGGVPTLQTPTVCLVRLRKGRFCFGRLGHEDRGRLVLVIS